MSARSVATRVAPSRPRCSTSSALSSGPSSGSRSTCPTPTILSRPVRRPGPPQGVRGAGRTAQDAVLRPAPPLPQGRLEIAYAPTRPRLRSDRPQVARAVKLLAQAGEASVLHGLGPYAPG